jgi:hypothetical protein
MKTTIPDELKKDVPQTIWGRTLLSTPVVMTVVATLLAGLASSEMTRAQYERAYAAQLQAKAGDQWGYFQAKKMRSTLQRNSLELLMATTDLRPVINPIFDRIPAPPPSPMEETVARAMAALEKQQSETEIRAALARVAAKSLAGALEAAKANAIAFDKEVTAANQAIDQAEKALPANDRAAARDFTAARMRQAAARYDVEARLNQVIANLYELQVRAGNVSAERHHRRSGKFFFGMLAAQAAVIIATFAIAAQKRNFLWTIAAVAGVAAIVFAIYVYLKV